MSKLTRIIFNGTSYEIGSTGAEVTDSIKTSLLQIAGKVAYSDENGLNYYNALEAALYPPADLESITAVYTQTGTVYDTATLDSLKTNLVVTAHMSDSTTRAVTNYTLSGTLAEGTSIITASYGGKDATFSVNVTHYEPIVFTITWSWTGTVSTSSAIDATERDVYLEIPFDSTDTRIKTGATAESNTYKERCQLYSDSACTDLIGYWYIDTQEIEAEARTTANMPWIPFDTQMMVAPKGYYVKLVAERLGSDVFDSNADAREYLNAHAASVTLR